MGTSATKKITLAGFDEKSRMDDEKPAEIITPSIRLTFACYTTIH